MIDDEIRELVPSIISSEDNEDPCAILNEEEVKATVNQLGAMKAIGLDGMSALFYQHYWSSIGKELVNMVQHFFRSGYMLKQMNH